MINTLFGFGHLYQGVTGVIENIIAGSILGLLYLGCGRNLWAPIIARGITDTMDLVLIFWGKYPGM
jgi:membrane protease YdiL (CAAX protease family)